jgi:nucleoside-diphosphate-sugar epimerase
VGAEYARHSLAGGRELAGALDSAATRGTRAVRVVITGAPGNVGTSVIEALAEEPAVTSVLGLARRRAGWEAPNTEWAQADLAQDDLVSHLRGADVLIHLAWLFQPTHDSVTTWRANVEGSVSGSRTRRALLDLRL